MFYNNIVKLNVYLTSGSSDLLDNDKLLIHVCLGFVHMIEANVISEYTIYFSCIFVEIDVKIIFSSSIINANSSSTYVDSVFVFCEYIRTGLFIVYFRM